MTGKHSVNYVILGAVVLSLLLGASQATAVSTSEMLLINTNPTGATVTLGYEGQVLGTTPVYIDPRSYSSKSPTSIILTKSGYLTKNIAIYSWMVPPTYKSLTYYMKPSSGTTPAPTPTTDNPPSVSATHSPASPTTADPVTITASATDDKGLTEITVYADNAAKVTCGSISGTSASCPYGAKFSAGTHSYYATAKDNSGKTATSATNQFTVSAQSTAPAPTNLLTIDSIPQGADVYCLYGGCAGKYLGKTPFTYDPTLNGGVTWMKATKAGYPDSGAVVYSYMVGKITIIL